MKFYKAIDLSTHLLFFRYSCALFSKMALRKKCDCVSICTFESICGISLVALHTPVVFGFSEIVKLSQKEFEKVKCFFASEEMFTVSYGNVSFAQISELVWGKNIVITRNVFLLILLIWKGIFMKECFLYLSAILWKYFVSGVETFCLWCGNILSLVWIFFVHILG